MKTANTRTEARNILSIILTSCIGTKMSHGPFQGNLRGATGIPGKYRKVRLFSLREKTRTKIRVLLSGTLLWRHTRLRMLLAGGEVARLRPWVRDWVKWAKRVNAVIWLTRPTATRPSNTTNEKKILLKTGFLQWNFWMKKHPKFSFIFASQHVSNVTPIFTHFYVFSGFPPQPTQRRRFLSNVCWLVTTVQKHRFPFSSCQDGCRSTETATKSSSCYLPAKLRKRIHIFGFSWQVNILNQ